MLRYAGWIADLRFSRFGRFPVAILVVAGCQESSGNGGLRVSCRRSARAREQEVTPKTTSSFYLEIINCTSATTYTPTFASQTVFRLFASDARLEFEAGPGCRI